MLEPGGDFFEGVLLGGDGNAQDSDERCDDDQAQPLIPNPGPSPIPNP